MVTESRKVTWTRTEKENREKNFVELEDYSKAMKS